MVSFLSNYFSRLFNHNTDRELKTLLIQYAEVIARSSRELESLFSGTPEEKPAVVNRLTRLKEEGDTCKRGINEILDHTFIIRWIDKEDITLLVNDMNRCMRAMRLVTKNWLMYRLQDVRPQIRPLVSCIVRMAQEIPVKIEDLSNGNFSGITDWNPHVNQLETEADDLCSAALSTLWQERGLDPLSVIKWERIYQGLEKITDFERNIADTILSISRSSQ